jgi:hypothetical protein
MRGWPLSLGLFGLLGACGSDAPGRWTMSEAKAALTSDDHVVVDVIYVNDGETEYSGSRCVLIEFQRGAVLTQQEARTGAAQASTIVETQRWCNGGNKSLEAADRDLFKVISKEVRATLAGTTIVVVGQDFKGTPNDDRVLLPMP